MIWFLFLVNIAQADDCSLELFKKHPKFASSFFVSNSEISDGKRKAVLSQKKSEAMCAELNRIVWEARKKERKNCPPFARIMISGGEDFQICNIPKEPAFAVMEWVRVRALPALEAKKNAP